MPDLFAALDRPPAVRGSATSQAAADSVRHKTHQAEANLLELFRAVGDRGLTDAEIASHFGWSGDFTRPRRWTLARKRLIRRTGVTRRTPAGCLAAVWVLNSNGGT